MSASASPPAPTSIVRIGSTRRRKASTSPAHTEPTPSEAISAPKPSEPMRKTSRAITGSRTVKFMPKVATTPTRKTARVTGAEPRT